MEFITGTLQHSLEQLCSQDSDSFQLVRDMLAAAISDEASGQVLSEEVRQELAALLPVARLGLQGRSPSQPQLCTLSAAEAAHGKQ
jgi:hypothetical protein